MKSHHTALPHFEESLNQRQFGRPWLFRYAMFLVTAASILAMGPTRTFAEPTSNDIFWESEPISTDNPRAIGEVLTAQALMIPYEFNYESLKNEYFLNSNLEQSQWQLTSNDLESNSFPTEFGRAGLERWYIQGSAATTLDDDKARRFGLLGAGISHFFANGHSVNVELNGLAFDQTGEDAVGLNLAVLLRWHFYRQQDWSLYVDGGAGILGTTREVPSAGSHFNFTPQVGGGATVRIKGNRRLMVGLRWHHISNADIYDNNPGRDSLMGYVGLNWSY